MTSLRGQLLIAMPALLDPSFRRTVVLVTEHTPEGALGLVLNRPSAVGAADAVPQLGEIVDPAAPLYLGGPVEAAAALVLAELEDPTLAAALVFDDVGLLGEPPAPEAVRRTRVFAGCAGWAAGQLEAELELESWLVEPAVPEDVFGEDAAGLWSVVLRRKGGHFAALAMMPLDPSTN